MVWVVWVVWLCSKRSPDELEKKQDLRVKSGWAHGTGFAGDRCGRLPSRAHPVASRWLAVF